MGPVDVTDDPYYTSPLGRRHFLPNLWPAAPAGFADAATAYYRAMSALIVDLMRLAALALDVPERFFDDKVNRSIGTMRLNYYPAQAAPPRPGQLRASAHTDYGGFTILSGEDVPGGLQVRTRGDRWVDVATSPTTFVVNIGDLLMRWTNDRWLSNLHRVVNPPAGAGGARLSIAFFNHPELRRAASSACRPRARPEHAPVLSGEYRDEKYAKTGLTGAARARGPESDDHALSWNGPRRRWTPPTTTPRPSARPAATSTWRAGRRAATRSAARTRADSTCATASGPRQRLDIFPCGTPGAPTLVYIHGGYWQMNDKEPYAFLGEGLLPAGFNLALIEYTLAPAARLDADRERGARGDGVGHRARHRARRRSARASSWPATPRAATSPRWR